MGNYGDQFSAAVAAELRAEKARRKKSFPAIAAETGLSRSAVMNYFNGARDTPASALGDICRSLGVDPVAIIDRAYKSLEED